MASAEEAAAMVAATQAFVGKAAEVTAWGTGTANGGPNGDGRYPFVAPDGTAVMVPSPLKVEAIAAAGGGGSGGGALASDYDCDLHLTYGVKDGESLSAALQAFFDDDSKHSLFIPYGHYTCTWAVHQRPVEKRVTCATGVRITHTAYPNYTDDFAAGLYRSPVTVRMQAQWIERVTAQRAVNTLLGEPGAGPSSAYELTMENARTVRKGQLVRIIADDRLEFGRDILAHPSLLFNWFPGNGQTMTVGGKTYTFQTNLTAGDGNVKIGADGIQTAANFAAAVNLAEGAGSLYSAGTTANPAATASRNNNVVSLIKRNVNDRAPVVLQGNAANVNIRTGFANVDAEFAVVGVASSGNTITLTSPLNGRYVTNVRVALLPEVGFTWEGGWFDQLPGITQTPRYETSPYAMFSIMNCIRPVVRNVVVSDAIHAAYRFAGCQGPRVEGALCLRLVNNTVGGKLGYGFVDVGCQGAEVISSTFIDVRHGVTTGAASAVMGQTPAATQLENFGGARDGYVLNCKGFACSAPAFDTHEDVQGYTFDGCVVEKGYTGVDGGPGAFSARGADVTFINCTARACENFIWMNGSRRVKIINCRGLGLTSHAIRMGLPGNPPLGPASNLAWGHRISDSHFEQKTGTTVFSISGMNFQPIDIELDNVRLTLGTVNAVFSGSGYNLTARDLTLDLYGWSGTADQFLKLIGGAGGGEGIRTVLNIDGLTVTQSKAFSPRNLMAITDGSFRFPALRARITNIYYDDSNVADGVSVRDWRVPKFSNEFPVGQFELNRFGVLGNSNTGVLPEPGVTVSGRKVLSNDATGEIYTLFSGSATITPAPGVPIDISHVADSEIFLTLIGHQADADTGQLPVANRIPGDKVYLFNDGTFAVVVSNFVVPAQGSLRLVYTAGAWRAF